MLRDRQADLVAVGVLVLVYVVWGGVLLAQGGRYCTSDCVVEMLPRLMAAARSFQSGVLPYWDVNTFSGAKPLWESTGGIYYPFLFPLYLLVDTTDPRQAGVLLHLVPYVLHVIWASLGAYVFARRILRLTIGGAMVVGLTYSVSPAMLEIAFVNQVQGYSYLPWLTLTAVCALDTGSPRMWAAGALVVGATCYATNPDLVNRLLFLLGLQVGVYWLLSRWRTASMWRDLRRLLKLIPMVIVGMATYTFGFVGLINGISLALTGLSLSCPQVAAFAEYSSAAPVSLLTLLFPGMLFLRMETLASAGGILLLSSASYALLTWARLPPSLRQWTVVGVVLFGFSTLIVLGDHTPFFGWMCHALPVFFGFPHPARYTVGMSWGLAMLAGVGVSAMTTSPPSRAAALVCSWPLIAAAVVTFAHPAIPSFEWQNRFASVSLYVIVAAVLLLAVAGLPARVRGPVIWAGVLAEVLVSPFTFALTLPPNARFHWAEFPTWSLAANSAAELYPFLRRVAAADNVRFVGTRAFIDNQAWVVNGRGLFGMMARPVSPRFERAFLSFTERAPYELWLAGLPHFLPNMNVGYVIADREPDYYRYLEYLNHDCGGFKAAVASLPLLEQTERFDIRGMPSPLPYIYTQDRIFVADADDQFARILTTDLREASYVSPEIGADHSAIITSTAPPPANGRGRPGRPCARADRDIVDDSGLSADALAHFDALQAANPVLSIGRSNPNRKTIELDVQRPALLVVAESWHPGWRARVDGKDTPVWEVNYLQQGVWVEPGTRVVELYFRPAGLQAGAAISATALVSIALIAVRGTRRRPAGARR